MSRKLLAVLVSSAFLWTGIATGASAATEPEKPAELLAAQTATTGNQPPLPPGRAINKAQGEAYDDLGPGVIIASWAAAIGVILLVVLANNGDDNDSTPPATGTN